MPQLPECMKDFAIAADLTQAVTTIEAIMEPAAGSVSDRMTKIDSSSRKAKDVADHQKLSRWMSTAAGSSGPFANRGFTRPKDVKAKDFFQELFFEVGEATGAQLNRADLFHAHLVLNGERGLVAVFHAKEYPIDTQDVKFQQARAIDPKCASFNSADEGYRQRNAVYEFRTNKLIVVAGGNKSVSAEDLAFYQRFVTQATNTLRETDVGTSLIDVNCFPQESKDYPVVFA